MKKKITWVTILVIIVLATAVFGLKYVLPVHTIYVSIEGGSKLNDKIGYSCYHYSHRSGRQDTLILSGFGYETDLVPRKMGKNAEAFNEGIIRARNMVATSKKELTNSSFVFNGKTINILFDRIDSNNKAQFTISVTKNKVKPAANKPKQHNNAV